MRTIITTVLVLSFIFPTISFAGAYECLSKKGKLTSCEVWTESGSLYLDYGKGDELIIPGKKITRLTEGEYARRRVAESIALGILVAPLALFGLFSKKQRDVFAIEYIDSSKNSDATMIQMKKKYSPQLRAKLQAISGKNFEISPLNYGKKKK